MFLCNFFSPKKKKALGCQLHNHQSKTRVLWSVDFVCFFCDVLMFVFAKMSCVDEITPWSQETQKLKFLVARSDSRIPCC